jgi:DNA-binding response OmpR family regulator
MSSTVLTNDTRVLIIDDDKSILNILSRILEKKGFSVDTAKSGHEALCKLAAKTYSAALIDVRLQDTNGLDLLIKIQEIAPKMRKIVLTGYPSDEDRAKALERGADYYIVKPVDSEKLIEIISAKTGKDTVNNF